MDGSSYGRVAIPQTLLRLLCHGKNIIDYLDESGKDYALQIDMTHGMTPLHMLTMNPHASADTITSLLDSNMEASFCSDNQKKAQLDYERDYNFGGLLAMITGLCIITETRRFLLERTRRIASMYENVACSNFISLRSGVHVK